MVALCREKQHNHSKVVTQDYLAFRKLIVLRCKAYFSCDDGSQCVYYFLLGLTMYEHIYFGRLDL